MAARVSSPAILRSAVLTHLGLSATSLLYSICGPPQQKTSVALPPQPPPPSSSPPRQRRDAAAARAALPWLEQLHDLITRLYVGGAHERGGVARDARVRIGADVAFENPLVSYAGAGETARAFRRSWPRLCPSNDVRTVIECVGVAASEDSIAGGDQPTVQRQGTSLTSLVSIPCTIMSPRQPSPPKVEVTYKLSQHYGAFFSTVSFLVVTVQVKRVDTSPRVRTMSRQNVAVPLATSGCATRAASTVAAAASHAGPASAALAQAASHLARRRDSAADPGPRRGAAPLVAEVARIEERWNGVRLLGLAPFRWSRRLNGVCVGGAALLLLSEG